jgi:hypothetical protein
MTKFMTLEGNRRGTGESQRFPGNTRLTEALVSLSANAARVHRDVALRLLNSRSKAGTSGLYESIVRDSPLNSGDDLADAMKLAKNWLTDMQQVDEQGFLDANIRGLTHGGVDVSLAGSTQPVIRPVEISDLMTDARKLRRVFMPKHANEKHFVTVFGWALTRGYCQCCRASPWRTMLDQLVNTGLIPDVAIEKAFEDNFDHVTAKSLNIVRAWIDNGDIDSMLSGRMAGWETPHVLVGYTRSFKPAKDAPVRVVFSNEFVCASCISGFFDKNTGEIRVEPRALHSMHMLDGLTSQILGSNRAEGNKINKTLRNLFTEEKQRLRDLAVRDANQRPEATPGGENGVVTNAMRRDLAVAILKSGSHELKKKFLVKGAGKGKFKAELVRDKKTKKPKFDEARAALTEYDANTQRGGAVIDQLNEIANAPAVKRGFLDDLSDLELDVFGGDQGGETSGEEE